MAMFAFIIDRPVLDIAAGGIGAVSGAIRIAVSIWTIGIWVTIGIAIAIKKTIAITAVETRAIEASAIETAVTKAAARHGR